MDLDFSDCKYGFIYIASRSFHQTISELPIQYKLSQMFFGQVATMIYYRKLTPYYVHKDVLSNAITAGLDLQYEPTKKNCRRTGYILQFQGNRWKALGEENSDLSGIFSVIIFWPPIF